MDIFELIRADHAEIRSLLNEVIDQTSIAIPQEKHALERPSDWEEALHDLKLSVVAHNRAEEEVLYSRIEDLTGRSGLGGGKTHEHRIAESLLAEIELMNPRDHDWSEKLALLRNVVESHQAEEETQTFELLKGAIDETSSDKLAVLFEKIRDRIGQSRRFPKGRTRLNPEGLNLDG